jgi:hypothetical protein
MRLMNCWHQNGCCHCWYTHTSKLLTAVTAAGSLSRLLFILKVELATYIGHQYIMVSHNGTKILHDYVYKAKAHTRSLDDSSSVGTSVVGKTASVGNSGSHCCCNLRKFQNWASTILMSVKCRGQVENVRN